MDLDKLLASGRTIHVLGIDDAPFDKTLAGTVNFAGVFCADTRFDGMLWGACEKDGLDAGEAITSTIQGSKFAAQIHLVLLDGITLGGANVVDIEALACALAVPVVAVMRRHPDVLAFRAIFDHLPAREERLRRTDAAGKIHTQDNWVFQCRGVDATVVPGVLQRLTARGSVPEALRLAHLIGAAVKFGESGRRA